MPEFIIEVEDDGNSIEIHYQSWRGGYSVWKYLGDGSTEPQTVELVFIRMKEVQDNGQ